MLTVCMCSSLKAADIDVQLVGVSNQNKGRCTAEQCIQARQIATLQHLTGTVSWQGCSTPVFRGHVEGQPALQGTSQASATFITLARGPACSTQSTADDMFDPAERSSGCSLNPTVDFC